MKIAIFTDTFFPELNGVANTLSYFNTYLKEQNISVRFYAPDYDTPKQHEIDADVVRIKGLQLPISPESRIAFPPYLFMKENIATFKPDIVHVTTQLGIGRLGVKYAEEFHVPLLMSYHTNFEQYLKFHQLEHLETFLWEYTRKFYSKSELTLCPSKDTLSILKEKNFSNLGIWSRGADLNKFNPKFYSKSLHNSLGGDQKLLFSYVGRISAEKDIDIYLDSIKLVNQQLGVDKINFIFTGVGPHVDAIKKENIPNVILTGPKSGIELSKLYASMDAFVFPSGTETFGNVLLEAMASGLPTISVNKGGVTDFAVHGVNSLVCDYHNPQSIADGIVKLANNPLLRQRLVLGALDTAKSRSWNSIFTQLLVDYQMLITNHQQVAV